MKTIEKYLNNTTFFKLKDFDKTNDKYKGYKNDKFFKWVEEYNGYKTVLDFEKLFSYNFGAYSLVGKMSNTSSKSEIRAFATEINAIMRDCLEAQINWIFDNELNANESRSFTIKFYLEYYKEINEAMTNILKSYIID